MLLLWMLLFLLLSVIMMIYSGHLEISIKFLISFLGRKEPSPDIQKAHKVSNKIIVKWPTHRHILMSFWGSRKKKSKRHLDRKSVDHIGTEMNYFQKSPLQHLMVRQIEWYQAELGGEKKGLHFKKSIFR